MKPVGPGGMDREEISRLYEEHGFYLFRRCRAMLRDETEAYDALQEVFLRLATQAPRLSADEPLLPWLNRVTTNHCLNRLRDRASRSREQAEAGQEFPSDPADRLDVLLERRDLVVRILDRYDERTREIVLAYFVDEMTVDETAAHLGIGEATVRRSLKRFLENAGKFLRRAGSQHD